MSRRSASNARYRKDAQVGSTRRSASSLKPKRDAGSSSPSKPSKKAAKPAYVDPPEVKKWRIAWAALLGLALVPVTYVLGPQALEWAGLGGWPVNPDFAKWGLYFEMTALAGALYIDFAIIRKIQTAAREAQKAGGKRSEKDTV